MTHTSHPCPGWDRASLRGNKVSVWRSNWPQPLYLLVCFVFFLPSFCLSSAFIVRVLRVSDLRLLFWGDITSRKSRITYLYNLQTQGKEVLMRTESTLYLAVGDLQPWEHREGRVSSPVGGTEVLILFPVEVRDIGEIEIKDTYFQKENLLHIYIYIYIFFFTTLEPHTNYWRPQNLVLILLVSL